MTAETASSAPIIAGLEAEVAQLSAALAETQDRLAAALDAAPLESGLLDDPTAFVLRLSRELGAPFAALILFEREGRSGHVWTAPDGLHLSAQARGAIRANLEQASTAQVRSRGLADQIIHWQFEPVLADRVLVGGLGIGRRADHPPFTRDDSAALAGYAERLRVPALMRLLIDSSEREHALRHELRIAGDIQRSIQPRSRPTIPTLDVDARWQPAHSVAGDAWGWQQRPDGQLGLFLLDVSGKGLPAAIAAMGLHTALRGALQLGMTPPEALAAANRLFYESFTDAGLLATAVTVLIDPATGIATIASAGHPPVLVRHGAIWSSFRAGAPPLAVLPAITPEADEVTLTPGDIILLYSDGLSEFPDEGVLWGGPQLQQAIGDGPTDAASALDRVMKIAQARAPHHSPRDDQTVVCVCRK